ncbi:hypothetical protein ACHAWF_005553, partial [Thalassiosira exigua]
MPAPKSTNIPPSQPPPDSMELLHPDDSPDTRDNEKLKSNRSREPFLYYARAINLTLLPGLSSQESIQSRTTKTMMQQMGHLLDYMTT